MPVVSAVPATVRLPRTAVVRRALLAAVFLGGFLVLAVVFGGGAQAAERGGPGTPDGGRATAGQVFQASEPGTTELRRTTERDRDTEPHRTTDAARRRSADGAAASVSAVRTAEATPREAVRPVEARLREVTEPVAGAVRDTTGALPVRLPAGGLLGGAPATPSGSDAPHGAPAAHGDAPEVPTPAGHHRAASRDAGSGVRKAASPHTATWDGAARAERPAPAVRDAEYGSTGRHAPVQGPLPGAPFGTAVQYSGNSGVPRGGDHAALPPTGAARFGLVPGALSADSSAPTRERFHDVLEFPG
ncbi:hypothetical protein ACZ90_31620 [Streptomyces albus subsp. albus]|nr:hypothetical protein ACZ90_31620 [Streptomyces albus subsp. albus]